MKSFSLVAAFAAAASALTFTAPAANDQWDLSQKNTIKWTPSTDAAFFKLVLVNHPIGVTESQQTIAENVTASTGSYDLTNFVATPGARYTIKAFGITQQNNGQLAETQPYLNITKSGVATSSSGTSSPTGSGTETGTGASASASKSSEAISLGKTFGVAGPLAVIFAMLA
ncbi:hypothetical protein B0H63DRAFT_445786 [Podospora didyma]|uniref:Yeast cell wall synthesis Kre9/Knh1-like N-terminal domain-containing protein n=1 Tax=Podospora didyma TaxID=330526 RepID=A0AAE0NXP0_9PEZI|nr:hypothetical protein B0H63DRAFT_445786 [Podospora didyma]